MRRFQQLKCLRAWTLFIALMGLAAGGLKAQVQTTGTPGTPSATTTIDGRYLPNAPQPFKGIINPNAAESKEYWPATIVPPKGAPNVLLIMTDDVGFGAPGTFGGVIPTPALDRIAKMGLRYTQFHSTALCSPTRAALITGRNHHSMGTGVITELSTGFPGYNSIFSKDKSTIASILQQNGYATSWFGKNHNTPAFVASAAGPFDQWPLGMGFDYFYGFVGGDASQWEPNLYRNTSAIYPYEGKPGWNLTTAMADEAIGWMNEINSIAPDKPFFCYYVPGGTHAPHHPTPEWIAKYKGKFDMGWNKMRDEIFANQKKMGIIPPETQLTPWPKDLLPEWESLNADQKKLYARQAEVYAAYLAYTDNEIGRVIQAVQDMGKLDNTIIIYISGDNGASAEGSLEGTPNEVALFNGIATPVDVQLKNFYDAWGTEKTYPHMSVAWAWAFDAPFTWTKQVASHFGGTRQGMCIAWPGHISDPGGIRTQFHHVIDVVSTLLEAMGIQQPVQVNGINQSPIEGTSMLYTFDKANANVPSHHRTQYFEMFGDRALYHDGWVLATTPLTAPWNLTGVKTDDPANGFKWELYNIDKDFSERNDLAASNPDKLKELQQLLWVELAKYNALPLDASSAPRLIAPRPSTVAGRTKFVYAGRITGIPHGSAPSILDKSYAITADVEVPSGGGEGVLITQGGRFGGWGLYLLKGKPVFTYNVVDMERFRWEGSAALSPGKHNVEFTFKYAGGGLAKGGLGELKVDGKTVSSKEVPHTLPFIFQWDETFDIGSDTGTPVNDADYKTPFSFTGKLNKVVVDLAPPGMADTDVQNMKDKIGKRD